MTPENKMVRIRYWVSFSISIDDLVSTDTEKMRPVGGIGGVEKLAVQRGQSLAGLGHQQGIRHFHDMLLLGLGEGADQRPQECFQGGRRAYNTSKHGGSSQ